MRTDAMPSGHLRMCERETHPNSLHPCNCGHTDAPDPAPQPPALCAKVIDGEPCATPADEPPHGKMSGHKFQPPADATACAREGCGHPALRHNTDGCMLEIAEEVDCPCHGFVTAAPPVTGDGDADDEDEALFQKIVDQLHEDATSGAIGIYHAIDSGVREAYAAGLARGRALGAREALDSLATTMKADLNRYTLNKHAREWIPHFLEAIEARRAGRGGK